MKKLKAVSLLIVSMIFAAVTSVSSGAAGTVYNGISVSNSDLSIGDDFYVFVDIPEISSQTANAVSLGVGFDNEAFEVTEIRPPEIETDGNVSARTAVTAKDTANSEGYFAFAASSDENNIILDGGYRFLARMKVKNAATDPVYSFTLYSASASYSPDLSGKNSVTIWGDRLTSGQKEVSVNVSSSDSPGAARGGGIQAYPDELYYGDTVKITVTIPEMPANYGNADNVAININYDSAAFRYVTDSLKFSPDVAKKNIWCDTSKSGLLAVKKRNSGYPAVFSEPITLEARFRVISTSKGTRTFELSPSVYYEDPVGNKVVMWNPKTEKSHADVYINTRYGYDPYSNDPTLDPYYFYNNYGDYVYWLYRSGISLSSSSTRPGDEFYVYVTIPDTYLYSDTAYLRVNYDPNEFEVANTGTLINGGYIEKGYGYFTISSLNWYQTYNTNRGYTYVVPMRVKSGAKAGNYSFRLTNSDFYYWYDGIYNYQNIWAPEYLSASMTVNSSWSDSWTYSPLTSPAQTTRDQPPAATQAPSVTRADVTEPIRNTPRDDYDDDTTRPASSYGTIGDTTGNNDDDYFTNDDDDDFLVNDDEDDDYAPSSDSNARISINQDLNGLSRGLIGVSTKSSYFPGDTVIVMRNTSDATAGARNALRSIGLGNSSYYAFDISLYNEETGRYYHDLLRGSAEFRIPVPKSLASATDRLRVYHTPEGIAEYIPSEIIYEDGVDKIVFSASSFSPYVIVDPQGSGGGNYVQDGGSQNSYPDDGIITPGGTVDPYDGNVNPHTGVTAAIVIPAALTGCVVLARKSKKHRRRARNKHIEE